MAAIVPILMLGAAAVGAVVAWRSSQTPGDAGVTPPTALTSARAADLARALAAGWLPVFGTAEAAEGLPAGILTAVASRETGMKDIVGDAGHGRGVFQIDDRSHRAWLASHGAADGGTPDVSAAATYAAGLVRSALDAAQAQGVPDSDRLKIALSAYNAGFTAALRAYRNGDSDAVTTGKDYGRDVLQRWKDLGYAGAT